MILSPSCSSRIRCSTEWMADLAADDVSLGIKFNEHDIPSVCKYIYICIYHNHQICMNIFSEFIWKVRCHHRFNLIQSCLLFISSMLVIRHWPPIWPSSCQHQAHPPRFTPTPGMAIPWSCWWSPQNTGVCLIPRSSDHGTYPLVIKHGNGT